MLTEEELATAFEHTFGMAPSLAAELAASHRGRLHRCLPDHAYAKLDPRDVWKRS